MLILNSLVSGEQVNAAIAREAAKTQSMISDLQGQLAKSNWNYSEAKKLLQQHEEENAAQRRDFQTVSDEMARQLQKQVWKVSHLSSPS